MSFQLTDPVHLYYSHFAHHLNESAARGLCRRLLAAEIGCSEDEVQFQFNKNGKPELSQPVLSSPLYFSTAHFDLLWILAVCKNRRIGIDIERLTCEEFHQDIVTRYYSPDERVIFHNFQDNQKNELFLSSWTKKEALIKARGGAISDGLDQFGIALMNIDLEQIFCHKDRNREKLWRLRRLKDWGDDYICHLAVENDEAYHIQVRKCSMATSEDVIKLVEQTLTIQGVNLDTRMGKIRGWDSLRHLRLMTAIEKKYEIRIPTQILGKLTTVKLIIDHLKTAGVVSDA